jgi:hypothetical protein
MSSTYSNVVIRDYDPISVIKLPVVSATVIAKGDLIDASADTATTLVAACHAGDNSLFFGVALEGSESGEVKDISIATIAKVNIKVVSGSTDALPGDAFKYSAGANGTAWQVTKATSEGIMWALEPVLDTAEGVFLINSHALAGGFIWDTCTEG